jgi:hypothetical protein
MYDKRTLGEMCQEYSVVNGCDERTVGKINMGIDFLFIATNCGFIRHFNLRLLIPITKLSFTLKKIIQLLSFILYKN